MKDISNLQFFAYHAIDTQIKHLELIKSSNDEEIKVFLEMLEDEEYTSPDDIKSLMLSLLVEIRRNNTQLSHSINKLSENNIMLLNARKKPSEHIKPYSDYEFKKRFAQYQ